MATLYLRSTDGSDADNGTTWALAKATAVGGDAIDAAGDTIYVSQAHAEQTVGSVALNFAGTQAAPTKVICGNDGAAPPTAGASTAVISTGSAAAALILNSTGHVYYEGIIFKAGVGASSSAAIIQVMDGSGVVTCRNCEFWTSTTGGSAATYTGGTSSSYTIWQNCNYKPAMASHLISGLGNFRWIGGSLLSGSAAVTTLIATDTRSEMYIEGVDLTNAATALALCTSDRYNDIITFHKCQLPASWSGVLNSGTTAPGAVIKMINCAAGATNYSYWVEKLNGSCRHEITIVRTGGATDGTVPISWKIVTLSSANWQFPFISEPLTIWNDSTSSVTASIYGYIDQAGLPTTDDIQVDWSYMGSAAAPLATIAHSGKANFPTAASNWGTDASTWGGGDTTTRFVMSTTLSPLMKGPVYAVIKCSKASATFYIDPKIVLT